MTSDKIVIENLRARGILGVDDWERTHRQDVVVTIELRADLREVGRTDRLEDTVNYRSVSKRVRRHIEKVERQTIEALAGDIAGFCLEEERVRAVTVRVDKPDALRGTGSVGVEVTREADE